MDKVGYAVARWLGVAREVNKTTSPKDDCVQELWLHPSHAGRLSEKIMREWVLDAAQVPDYHRYYPIHVPDKHSGCVYVYIHKNSPLFGRLFRLTAHTSNHTELAPETHPTYLENLAAPYPTNPIDTK